ncbi:MAG: type II toxin-antitoxin system RelE/ParE family toxin, partial [Candidatus Omnitrophica bacterium]|nr:type II toxin-antitoxin system RelE/ParE family toxin [Candidatus Omnitrophota bacterium]
RIEFTKKAEKEYAYLYRTNKSIFKRVRNALKFLAENPTQGKPLKFTLKGKWSYRVGSYRIIYSIAHNILTVYILDIGHRREIYNM